MKADRAVFLDRDDTLIRNVPYLGDPTQVVPIPGAPEAIKSLKDAGFLLFVVSNQSGVGRGLITEDQVHAVNAEMERQFGEGILDGYYMCYGDPADPEASRDRKPSPALLFQARDENGLDLAASYMVGDKQIDIDCGHNAGCRSVLVRTGEFDGVGSGADFSARDIGEATEWILEQERAGTG
jgi:D-glycero-D-manno-heptose 1,7-bisphosphate phosphatase